MPLRLPRVFLSSTFYDLRDLRDELGRFIKGTLGYELLASELPSFPIDPDANTVENCTRRVREEADILVLVVGGRYGQVPADRTHSVTNMEYVAARAKGIPIYAFVRKEVLDLLPVFAASPDADFTKVVDSPRLLEFVNQLRDKDRIWVSPFESAPQIMEALRIQFAYRLAAGLDAELQMRSDPEGIHDLRGKALQLAVEKPPAWKGYLMAECLRQALDRHRADYDAYRSGASWGTGERVADPFAWVQRRMAGLINLPQGLGKILDDLLNEAMEDGDVRRIASGAKVYGDAFKSALDWVAGVRRDHLEADCEPLRAILAQAPDAIIAEMYGFPNKLADHITSTLSGNPETKEVTMSMRLYLTPGWENALERELERLNKRR